MKNFAARLITWHRHHGRHDLPWQQSRDPYRVWLSEIMLQQTQVATVIPYYQRFLARFPTLAELAAAPVEDVMALWSGLGYYARARNLHACARAVVVDHGGAFPHDPAAIAELPGIGRSTANAIAAFCFGARAPILDGNVKRVFARCFGIEGFPGTPAVEREMWHQAEALMPARQGGDYIQAQMDLGATVCTRGRPRCEACPLAEICVARQAGRQAELPVAKPRKALPEREAIVLLLCHEGRVLLEQRPPSGIWGGLLSLPELPAGADPEEYAQQVFGCEAGDWEELPGLVHTFTHFRLHLTPLRTRVRLLAQTREGGARWLDFSQLDDAPLPAPIRRILAGAQEAG
ncbi:A/G-specific adenine glycosylase [Denitratisoma oestradiolicum]|uniref:Adenine DNA glycosylase n=1 Tax=Denitratisoma oestradiolicum TaxID=311182 RepID=A0A6S6Y3U0_9PROT|nr:A/G-specific adenine glycosylase [Denitratisoma oestradiolicum]TWO80933.1 A/G-specific adenine glycosylase [Denitratisoma oestradiolicum]CAB1367298.1 Adenine DNA glycosylase [Denitratisoma oestradiolicum]